MLKHQFAPKDLFEKMLLYMPIATFDLVIEYGNKGVIVCKRKIAPYASVWSLPGLRMLKGESIDETLSRIAEQEVGLDVDVKHKILIGQYVGKFSTESNRQDISTGYIVKASDKQQVSVNSAHFSNFRVVKTIPKPVGAMYKYYLKYFFDSSSY